MLDQQHITNLVTLAEGRDFSSQIFRERIFDALSWGNDQLYELFLHDYVAKLFGDRKSLLLKWFRQQCGNILTSIDDIQELVLRTFFAGHLDSSVLQNLKENEYFSLFCLYVCLESGNNIELEVIVTEVFTRLFTVQSKIICIMMLSSHGFDVLAYRYIGLMLWNYKEVHQSGPDTEAMVPSYVHELYQRYCLLCEFDPQNSQEANLIHAFYEGRCIGDYAVFEQIGKIDFNDWNEELFVNCQRSLEYSQETPPIVKTLFREFLFIKKHFHDTWLLAMDSFRKLAEIYDSPDISQNVLYYIISFLLSTYDSFKDFWEFQNFLRGLLYRVFPNNYMLNIFTYQLAQKTKDPNTIVVVGDVALASIYCPFFYKWNAEIHSSNNSVSSVSQLLLIRNELFWNRNSSVVTSFLDNYKNLAESEFDEFQSVSAYCNDTLIFYLNHQYSQLLPLIDEIARLLPLCNQTRSGFLLKAIYQKLMILEITYLYIAFSKQWFKDIASMLQKILEWYNAFVPELSHATEYNTPLIKTPNKWELALMQLAAIKTGQTKDILAVFDSYQDAIDKLVAICEEYFLSDREGWYDMLYAYLSKQDQQTIREFHVKCFGHANFENKSTKSLLSRLCYYVAEEFSAFVAGLKARWDLHFEEVFGWNYNAIAMSFNNISNKYLVVPTISELPIKDNSFEFSWAWSIQ